MPSTNNRDPLPGEVKACKPYLDEQIETISPKIIVALGRHSFGKFFSNESISKARGKPRPWNGVTVYPMYHPAAALRNPKLRTSLEDDFRSLNALLQDSPAEYQEPKKESSEQLSLF